MTNEPIFAKSAPAAVGPYSHAVRVGKTLYTSGQLGINPNTGDLVEGVGEQARVALENLAAVLAAAGLSMDDVVKTTVFLKDMGDFAQINEIYAKAFGDAKPARSCVAVASLPKGGLFEIEAIAHKE